VISSCPYTITSPGSYVLESDLSSASTCITVSSGGSESSIDCLGHSITGPGTGSNYGVYLDNSGRVTLENCRLSRFQYDLYLNGGGWHGISNMTLSQATSHGLYVYGSSYSTLAEIRSSSNAGAGAYFYSSSYNALSGLNASYNYGCGMQLHYSSSYNNVSGSEFGWNADHGVYITQSSNYNSISGSEVHDNQDNGIYAYSWYITTTGYNVLDGNSVTNNSYGIYLYEDQSRSDVYNYMYNITGNAVFGNRNDGIRVYNVYQRTDSHKIIGNNVSSNAQEGIYLYNSNGNNVSATSSCGNAARDIYCNLAQPSGTGNTCSNLSCSGVTCASGCP
jgi:parallel beta-helix repeat protein